LDYYIFTYTFSSTELVRKRTSLIACCVVESSANIKDIDPNTLRVIISRAFRGGDVPRSTLTAIYAQLVMAINEPTDGLSLTDNEKEVLENWYQPANQKLVTNGTPAGKSPVSPLPSIQTGFQSAAAATA
jgi:hypothetical protein